jgi:hypothetical protein
MDAPTEFPAIPAAYPVPLLEISTSDKMFEMVDNGVLGDATPKSPPMFALEEVIDPLTLRFLIVAADMVPNKPSLFVPLLVMLSPEI